MSDAFLQGLQTVWQGHAPDLLLVCALLLLFTGFPIAFILGGTTLLFALLGDMSGIINLADYQTLPAQIFNQILLDPALLALPLLLFFCELLIETGQMAGLSKLLKAQFQPANREAIKSSRAHESWKPHPKPKKPKGPNRSIFMMLFVPGAVLGIVLARIFEIPTEFLTLGLLPISLILIALYLVNWILGMWVEASHQKLKRDWLPNAADQTQEAVPKTERPSRLALMMSLLSPMILAGGALVLLIHYQVSLFATLAILSLGLILLALAQGRLGPGLLLNVMNRAAITTGSIAAILIAAYCFHLIFLDLGGAVRLEQFASMLVSAETGPQPWLALLALLFALSLLGLVFDWLILAAMVIPLLMPIFTHMDFNSLLTPKWAGIGTHFASIQQTNLLTANEIIIQAKLWFAALLWLSLMTALVTYARQNGEMATKTLAPGQRKTQTGSVSLHLFIMLQLIGLGACLIMPETVLWLPSLLIR
nr:hypothetical protein [uncultured Cohaesibacter sp.]